MQSTEDRIGPYELHDFFLYHILRTASRPPRSPSSPGRPGRTPRRARWPLDYPDALKREYDLATIRKWLEVFLFRFFQLSQYKRSAMPNSPKVSAGGALSPARRLARAERRQCGAVAGRAEDGVRGAIMIRSIAFLVALATGAGPEPCLGRARLAAGRGAGPVMAAIVRRGPG